MKLYVGTSGYAYKEWKGSFYPRDLPAKRMLHFYGEHFRTVEINNTLYRMPTAPLLQTWANEVPPDFKFVLKASQRITHQHRLVDADDEVGYLLDVAATLQSRLGALLFQLPPHRAAFEFRHASWFDDEVFALLHAHQAALCIAEAEGDLEVPVVATADWGYLRLRRPDYGEAELKAWVQRVQQQAWQEAFVFFKHGETGRGPQLAQWFLELAAPVGAPARSRPWL